MVGGRCRATRVDVDRNGGVGRVAARPPDACAHDGHHHRDVQASRSASRIGGSRRPRGAARRPEPLAALRPSYRVPVIRRGPGRQRGDRGDQSRGRIIPAARAGVHVRSAAIFDHLGFPRRGVQRCGRARSALHRASELRHHGRVAGLPSPGYPTAPPIVHRRTQPGDRARRDFAAVGIVERVGFGYVGRRGERLWAMCRRIHLRTRHDVRSVGGAECAAGHSGKDGAAGRSGRARGGRLAYRRRRRARSVKSERRRPVRRPVSPGYARSVGLRGHARVRGHTWRGAGHGQRGLRDVSRLLSPSVCTKGRRIQTGRPNVRPHARAYQRRIRGTQPRARGRLREKGHPHPLLFARLLRLCAI